ncbi:TPA: DNA-processing protein DprA [Vibrio parahaemolyticus]
MISEETKFLLSLRYIKGIGKKYLNEIASASESSGISIFDSFASSRVGKATEVLDALKEAESKAQEQVSNAIEYGHYIISRLDPLYPSQLKSVADAPPILFCSGNLDLLNRDIVTIIGTREPTEHGSSIAEKITQWFSQNNWVVASGLAKGIDTIAHDACLNVSGDTISVLAHGLERVYPAQNKVLAKEIVNAGGLLISEYGYNSYVGKSNFVERDRVQAAIANAVVLVQSDLNGGSMHASRAILEYERFLVVVGQSRKDIRNNEAKITANMTLFEGDELQKTMLLKCSKDKLAKVLLMPDKSYLEQVDEIIRSTKYQVKEVGTTYSMF